LRAATVVLLALFVALSAASLLSQDPELLFKKFVNQYNKDYATNTIEYQRRFLIFKDNLKRIDELNSRQKTAKYAINKFADLSPKEFSKKYKGYNKTSSSPNVPVFSGKRGLVVPSSFDWRTKGVVTPVKDQGQCGSCWAFSATEGVESAWIFAKHPSVELAPQQIVDCDQSDQGCNGGDLPTAFEYVKQNGMEPESDYPYAAVDQDCQYNSQDVVARIKSWGYATQSQDENQMLQASYTYGPLSICVDASNWSSYEGGVVTSDCGTDLDHCVQLVGWDTYTDGTPYWIIRNSWGTSWGINGFIYVERGQDLCGVAEEPTYIVA